MRKATQDKIPIAKCANPECGRTIRFHDLRHTCASLMHKMGLSPKEVQDYLGHSTVSVTLNIYTHLDWSSKENAAKAMENAVKLPENVQITSKWES